MQIEYTPKQQDLIKYAFLSIILSGLMIIITSCGNTKTATSQAERKEQVKKETTFNSNKKNKKLVQIIQKPPVYPGCEGKSGKEQKICLIEQIQLLISKNFNTSIASNLGLNGKNVKILTMFTVGKDGRVYDIKVRSDYPELAEEAKRVLALIPQMKPGEQNNKVVRVTYTLPIIFKVKEKRQELKAK